MTNISQALLAAQQDMPALQRNGINPHFQSRFITLDSLMEQILPVLNKHGLVLTQMPTVVDGMPALRTRLTHPESRESIEDAMLLVLQQDTPQGQGSAITYARRYSLMSALGLVADQDDDANGAQPTGQAASTPVRRPQATGGPRRGTPRRRAAESEASIPDYNGDAPW